MQGPVRPPVSGKGAKKKVTKTTGLINPLTGKFVSAQPTIQDLINGARSAKFSNPDFTATMDAIARGDLVLDSNGNATWSAEYTFQALPGSQTFADTLVPPPPVYTLPETVRFNLPPHNSSLPIRPSEIGMGTYATGGDASQHNMRRAILWYYGSADTTTNAGLINSEGSANAADTTLKSTTGEAVQYNSNPKDNNWGFQFLWNPETISTTTTRNSNVVPSNLDKFANVNSLFTAMEALNFSITIDRTVDFAFAKALYNKGASGFDQYYTNGYPGDQSETFDQKFDALMKRGTLADIEYIYRAINGSGQNGNMWLNGFGQETAELGFLSPVAIAVRFGPDANSISYVGWVESLQIQHTRFTENMIPINSVVNVQFNAFSRVSLNGASPFGPGL